MNKSSISNLAQSLVKKKGLSQETAEEFIRFMFEVADEAIQTDKILRIRWLGTFKITAVKDRESIDVNTGERILIEGRDKITFVPDNVLKDIVNKPFAQFETVVVNDGVDFTAIDEKFALSTVGYAVPKGHEFEENEELSSLPVKDKNEKEVVESQNFLTMEETQSQREGSQLSSTESLQTFQSMSQQFSASKTEQDVIVIEEPKAAYSVTSQPNISDEVVIVDDSKNTTKESAEQNSMGLNKQVDPNKFDSKSVGFVRSIKTAVDAENGLIKDSIDRHHIVIPKFWIAITVVVFIILISSMSWFAFNYGKMQAQRDHLAMHLNTQSTPSAIKYQTAHKPQTDSNQLILQEKAKKDSIRLAESNNTIQMAEESEKVQMSKGARKQNDAPPIKNASGTLDKDMCKNTINASNKKEIQQHIGSKQTTTNYYDDARVRTGAYRIIGIDHIITVKEGQSLTSISKQQLGPGMECYIEAVNSGLNNVKPGQKVKIPKLELKRKTK